jgi:undecaprenyl-diphosphatase
VLWAARHLVSGREVAVGAPAFAVGIVASGIAGFLAIHYLLRYVRTRSFAPFVGYRMVVGVLVLVLALTRG